ncbi:MAG: DUF6316 family protein [Pseudomonadota bacterium]
MRISVNQQNHHGQHGHEQHSHEQHSQMTKVRKGEQDKFRFRSDRFFTIDSQWYFTTREGVDVGPFDSRDMAANALTIFIDCVEKQGSTVERAISIAKQGNWAVVGFH